MKCAEVQLLLVDDLGGELEAGVAAQVKEHVEQCAPCRAEMDEMAGTVALLTEVFRAAGKKPLRLDDLHRGRIMLSRKRKVGLAGWMLRAAALVVLLGGLAGLLMPAMSGSRGKAIDALVQCEMNGMHAGLLSEQKASPAEDSPKLALDMPAERDAEYLAGTREGDRQLDKACESAILPPAAPSTPLHEGGDMVSRRVGVRKMSLGRYGGAVAKAGEAEDGKKVEKAAAESAVMIDQTAVVLEQAAQAAQMACEGTRVVEMDEESPRVVMKGLTGLRRGRERESSTEVKGDESGRDEARPSQSKNAIAGTAIATQSGNAIAGKAIATQSGNAIAGKAIAKLESAQPMRKDAVDEYKKKESYDMGLPVAMDRLEELTDSYDGRMDPSAAEHEMPVGHNAIVDTAANRFSTFSIDVDTASFTMARRALLSGKVPAPAAVRVEEFINAFDQDYRPPEKRTFAVYTDRARSPFRAGVESLRIGVRGRVLGRDQQKASVLTMVVDTSGSMNTPDRIGLIKRGIRMLVDGLGPADRLAIVTFGAKATLALDMTLVTDKSAILAAVERMETQGATHLEGGLRLGYEIAARHFGSGCLNRVILMSDGVANLGAATADEILQQVEGYRKQGIYCSVYGFGQGTYNDAMLESLADKGDGVYRFIDSEAEAKRVFVDDLSASFQVIARDVKIQVEFDPRRVKSYRQLGYEKRQLTQEQFRDDRVDAGEVGSGQSVTALYDLEVTGNADEPLGMVRIRWRDANTGVVEELAEAIRAGDRHAEFGSAPVRFRLAAGAAELAGILRGDPISLGTSLQDVEAVLRRVGLEMQVDRQVQDLVKMATAAQRLMK